MIIRTNDNKMIKSCVLGISDVNNEVCRPYGERVDDIVD